MGMAASQARYLSLVARKTNCEYEGQQINQARTALGNQSANLFNQMLGLQVPVPPSTQDFTKIQYSFCDGANTYTIDKWHQVQSPNSDYNYIVDYHYNADIYTGSEKKLVDPQIQFTGQIPEVPDQQQIADIRDALRNIENRQKAYDDAFKDYNDELIRAKRLSNYADTTSYGSNIVSATYDPATDVFTITRRDGTVSTFTNVTQISPTTGFMRDPATGNIICRDPNTEEQFVSDSADFDSQAPTNYTPVDPSSRYQPDVNTYYSDLENNMWARSHSTIGSNNYSFIEDPVTGKRFRIDSSGNVSTDSIEDINNGLQTEPAITQITIEGITYDVIYNPSTGKNYLEDTSVTPAVHYEYTEPFNAATATTVEDICTNLQSAYNDPSLLPITAVLDSNGNSYQVYNDGIDNYIFDGTDYFLYPGTSTTFDIDDPATWGTPYAGTPPTAQGLLTPTGSDVKQIGDKYYYNDLLNNCSEFDPKTGTFSTTSVVDTILTPLTSPLRINEMRDASGNPIMEGIDGQRYARTSATSPFDFALWDYTEGTSADSLNSIIAGITPDLESISGNLNPIYYCLQDGNDYVGVSGGSTPQYYEMSTYTGAPDDVSIQAEHQDLLARLSGNPIEYSYGRDEIESIVNDMISVGALPEGYDIEHNVYVDTDGNIAFKSDLTNLIGIAGTSNSLPIYSYNVINNEINTVLADKYAVMQAAELALNTAKMQYAALSVPSHIGNCEVTPLLDLTPDQETEIKQIIKDMKDKNINSHIIDCIDSSGQYIGASIYTFKMNGQTYYTTYVDLVETANKGGLPNDIDIQNKLPYYNATYINQKIENTTKALLETDGAGRFKSVRFEDDSNTYTLKMETITDDEAYNDAMNQYYYENAKYDKMVQDINARTSIIQQEDRTLELRLKQLETEQNAVKTEIEAVQGIIKDNVKDTFGTFKG